MSALDRILGFIFGIFRGVIIVILLQIMISSLIPEESQKGVFAESKYFKLAGDAAGPIKSLIPEKWFEDLKAKGESFGLGDSKATEKSEESKTDDEAKDTEEKATDNTAGISGEVLKKAEKSFLISWFSQKLTAKTKHRTMAIKKMKLLIWIS